jgi:hypothetical protein
VSRFRSRLAITHGCSNVRLTLPITRRRQPLNPNRKLLGGRCAWALLGCYRLLKVHNLDAFPIIYRRSN